MLRMGGGWAAQEEEREREIQRSAWEGASKEEMSSGSVGTDRVMVNPQVLSPGRMNEGGESLEEEASILRER
jgi:hypothetical protein